MHDPRVGRFFSRDPLSAKYPWNSPYVFSENRLIDGVELEGLEVELITMQARAGLYGKTVQKVVAGTQDGISESINQTYDFLTDSAWKTTTWKTIGNSLGQFLACPEPAFDRAQVDFDKKIINGDAYSRSKYISKGATDIATIYVGSKGANLLLSEALNISKISLLQ